MEVKVEYKSNNSGGSWWLDDKQWAALEAAGWVIDWYANQKDRIFKAKDGRWLGALASAAHLECETPRDAILAFEKVTGLDASEEGCNCCGPPHYFSWNGGGASGEDILTVLHGDRAKLSKREMLEQE